MFLLRTKVSLGVLAGMLLLSSFMLTANAGEFAPSLKFIKPDSGQAGDIVELRGIGLHDPKIIFTLVEISSVSEHPFPGLTLTGHAEVLTNKAGEELTIRVPRVRCPDTADCASDRIEIPGVYSVVAHTAAGESNKLTFTIMSEIDDGGVLPDDGGGEGGKSDTSGEGDGSADGGGHSGSGEPAKDAGTVLGATTVCSVNAHREAVDFIQNTQVPTVVADIFWQVYGRAITPVESANWKARARCDKPTQELLTRTMRWHYHHGSTGVGPMSGLTSAQVTHLFEAVYDRVPSASEQAYWNERDLQSPLVLLGALQWHKLFAIQH